MKELTQLKMEIRRQSGDVIVGMVPVNQENYILGSTCVCLKEHRSGQLALVSLHLNLLQEDHWIFDGLDQKAPIPQNTGPPAQRQRQMCLPCPYGR